MFIKATARIEVDKSTGAVRARISNDFVNYYKSFIEKHFWFKVNTPKHGGHISIVLPKHHGKDFVNKAMFYNGKKVEFEYDPDIIVGAKNREYRNFWMKIRSNQIEQIKKNLGVKDNKGYLGLHITIANTKFGWHTWFHRYDCN